MRKPVSGVSDKVRHKPGCCVTEDGKRLEMNVEFRNKIDCTIYVVKRRFSHDAAHLNANN